MTQPFALKQLLEIAENTAESAAASLGVVNRELARQEEKLALLLKYRSEYQERLRKAAGAGLDGAGLRNFHEFLDRLEQAILQQRAQVAEAHTRVDTSRQDWQLKERKSKAFGTLAQRYDAAAQRGEATREQKLQDDFASRTSRTSRTGTTARSHALAVAKGRR